MLRSFTGALIVFVLLPLSGCALRSGMSGDGGRYQTEIGTSSLRDIDEKSVRLLLQNQFHIERREVGPVLLIETDWRERRPFDDEIAVGVERAQTRITLTGRPRGQTGLGTLYNLRMLVENRVLPVGSDEWSHAASTPEYQQWAEDLATELRRELVVGVRVY